MSLLNDASLVMIPSGYKDTKLYSVKPTNGDGDFTFSRGSNLAATRVNSEGLIEKGRENLLLQSNSFNTTWIKNQGGTFTSGQEGYDGTNDAWQFNVTTASNSGVYQVQNFSGVSTFSAYFKKGTIDKVGVTDFGGQGYACWFDLTNGTIGQQTGNLIDAKIESVGNGWYRCSITDTASGANYFQLKPSDDYNAISIAGYIFIQDAQVELGLVATDVITTTTTTAQAGILEDMPRLDYSGGASCPSLLLEPQRSNLMVQSEAFSTSDWVDTATNVNVTANATISPEGVQNASEIEFTNTGASIFDQFTNVASSMHIGTIFLKNKDVNTLVFEVIGGAPSIEARVTVDLVNGTLSNATGDFTPTIEDFGNGWYRVAIGDTGTATIATPSFKLESVGGNTGSFYAYGAMVEAGSYPTSYIPTYGSSVTRSADICKNISATALIGQTEGTLLCEINTSTKTLTSSWAFSVNDGTASNCIGLRRSGGNEFFAQINVGGSSTALIGTGITSGVHKIAIAYANNDIQVYADGSSVGTDTSSAIPSTSVIEIGDLVSNRYLDDSVKQLVLFPTRLSNDELATLTTL